MKKNIVRGILTLTILAAMIVLVSGQSGNKKAPPERGLYHGVYCWEFPGYSDTLSLSVHENGGHYLAYGRWEAGGAYSYAVAGSISLDYVYGGYDISLHTTDSLDHGCLVRLHIKLTSGLDGTWRLDTTWLSDYTWTTNSGDIINVPCTLPMAPREGEPANRGR